MVAALDKKGSRSKRPTPKKKQEADITLVVGDDKWEVFRALDDIRTIVRHDEEDARNVIVVDPGSRRIIMGWSYTYEALGVALAHAVDVSDKG
jgi:hypothetical protein